MLTYCQVEELSVKHESKYESILHLKISSAKLCSFRPLVNEKRLILDGYPLLQHPMISVPDSITRPNVINPSSDQTSVQRFTLARWTFLLWWMIHSVCFQNTFLLLSVTKVTALAEVWCPNNCLRDVSTLTSPRRVITFHPWRSFLATSCQQRPAPPVASAPWPLEY